MKKYTRYTLLLILLYSCLKDYTKEGDLEISEITVSHKLTDYYERERWETLIIDPKPTQSIPAKELAYEWEIDYTIISTEPVLNYVCKDVGEKKCRLKIFNDNGAVFRYFRLQINSPYEEGVVILSKYKDGSLFSFKRTDLENQAPFKDAYTPNNPNLPLGKTPKFVYFHAIGEGHGIGYVHLGTTDPLRVLRIDEKTFEVLNVVEFEKGATPERIASAFSPSLMYELTVLGGGTAYNYKVDQASIDKRISNRLPPDTYLSNQGIHIYSGLNIGGLRFVSALILYDENLDRLLTYSPFREWIQEELPGTFTGMTAIRIMQCDNYINFLLVMKNQAAGLLHVMHCVNRPWWEGGGLGIANDVEVAGRSTLTENSIMVTDQQHPVMYYSANGNSIYRYNYLASNLPTSPFITIAAGSIIRSMIIYGKTLYVGTYNPVAEEYKGDLYCFDIESKKLLWKEEALAGDIVDMTYKRIVKTL